MYGQLGHGDKASYRSPKRVESLTGVVDALAGDDFTLAMLEDSQLVSAHSDVLTHGMSPLLHQTPSGCVWVELRRLSGCWGGC